MKLYTFIKDGAERLGAETKDGQLVDLRAVQTARGGNPSAAMFDSMLSLIDAGEAGLAAAREILDSPPKDAVLSMASVRIAPPLPRPRKLWSGSSFDRHLKQSAEATARMLAAKEPDPKEAYHRMKVAFGLEEFPKPGWYEMVSYYFPDVTALCGQDTKVDIPAYTKWMDYELELTAITGKSGKDIRKEDARSYIFGYSILNDLSARDMQLACMSKTYGPSKGKDFDNSNPFGPCIVTVDEIPDPFDLETRIRVNDEEWTRSSTRQPVWRFEDFIAFATQSQTMRGGEIISTGCTPYGCATELERIVKAGDKIELEVVGIGALRTYLN